MCFRLRTTVCSWLDKVSCTINEVCAIWCKSLVLGVVLHFARYMRCFALWVCGFVNCVFDQMSPVVKKFVLAIEKNCNCNRESFQKACIFHFLLFPLVGHQNKGQHMRKGTVTPTYVAWFSNYQSKIGLFFGQNQRILRWPASPFPQLLQYAFSTNASYLLI